MTYWIRRVLVVVLAVAVLVGIVWYLANRTSRSSAGSETAAAVTSAAPTMTGVLANSTGPSRSTAPTAGASPSQSAGASPTVTASPKANGSDPATSSAASASTAPPTTDAPPSSPPETTSAPPPRPAPPPPSYDAEGRLLCADADVTLTAQVPAEVKAGATVIVGMTIANSGAQPCRRDVSGTLQVFTVFAVDGTRLWSTADCFPGTGTEVRDLAPGQSLNYTVKWSGTTSTPGCAGERSPLAPGTHTLIAQLGALSSPPAPFTVG